MSLPNLAAVAGKATPPPDTNVVTVDGITYIHAQGRGTDEGRLLAASAPVLAELLIECADALEFAQRHAKDSWWANAVTDSGERLGDYPVGVFNDGQNYIAALLARLAEFDATLGGEQ